MEIKINNLTKKYADLVAVDNINLDIRSNEIFALLGVNGAGKTTTIKMLSGLISKDNGNVTFDELNLDTDIDFIKQYINISPQETAIAPNLTVKENILFIAEIYGIVGETAKKEADKTLEMFELSNIANKKARLLSGGMQRRLSIAMSIITKPKVLFLDEPTLGLDVISRSNLWELIKSLKEQMTIILTTHYMEEAENLADRVAIMNAGKIIALGTPKDLIKKSKSKNLEEAFIKTIKEAK